MAAMKHPIPDAALDDRLGFVGTSGSGKTYSAGTAVERILDRNGRVIIIDPLGVWWGLRLAASGERPSAYDVVIFGGSHGDLPLNDHAGALIGETVAGIAQSCIIDLSAFGTKAAARRFMLAFLTALYRHASKDPVHLIFDESDMWAPQRLLDKEGEAAKLLGQMETIVRRGRVLGFIPWLITQRPAVLSKDVLSQADGLVIMKLTSSQDRDAIGDWVEGQADKAQWRSMWASLPTLQTGHGLVWIPGRDMLDTVTFPAKLTYDSSRAPRRGEKRRAAVLAALDLPTLREKLAAVETEAKANDPRELRAEIARLKAELQKQSVAAPHMTALEEAHQRGFAAGVHEHQSRLMPMFAQLEKVWQQYRSSGDSIVTAIDRIIEAAKVIPPTPNAKSVASSKASVFPKPLSQVQPIASSGIDLPKPQRKILASLAFWRSVDHETPSRPMVAAVAGYSPSSGGFNNLVSAMRTAGLIEIPAARYVSLTDEDIARTNGGMSTEEARDFVLTVLSAPQRRLVEAAAGAAEITRDDLAQRTGYSANSGGFNNLISALCTLDIFIKPRPGSVGLSDWARKVLE